MLIGADLSYYDQLLDWKRYTWDFAFIKASEGTIPDVMFKRQWNAAEGYTIRAPYHFFRPSVNVNAAGDKFLSTIGAGGELPPILDLEEDDGDPTDVAVKAIQWLNMIAKATHKTPIVYTSVGFMFRAKIFDYDEFAAYPLWLAEYLWDKVTPTWSEQQRANKIYSVINAPATYRWPMPPKPFKRVDFVQWTAKCLPQWVPGYPMGFKKAVDVSFYQGDMKQLFSQFNIRYVPKPKGDDPVDTVVTMTADLINNQQSRFRADHNLLAPMLEMLTGPKHIECVGQKIQQDGYYWSEVIRVDGQDKHGWIAWTTSYTNVVILSPQLPDPATITKSVIYFTKPDGTEGTLELYPQKPQ